MREAVIVSVARTPIGKAYRGAFNDTEAPVLAGHAVREAVRRAGIEGAEVEDLVLGCATQQGTQGYNIARLTVVTGGLPESVAGMTIDRKCASGLMAIATAAKQVVGDGMAVVVAGGVESISLTQNKHLNSYRAQSEAVLAASPNMYMAMIETAEVVARRYGDLPRGAGPLRAAEPAARRCGLCGRPLRRGDRCRSPAARWSPTR